jgi:hypothetical protein
MYEHIIFSKRSEVYAKYTLNIIYVNYKVEL